jgi:hypothetical protein
MDTDQIPQAQTSQHQDFQGDGSDSGCVDQEKLKSERKEGWLGIGGLQNCSREVRLPCRPISSSDSLAIGRARHAVDAGPAALVARIFWV